MLLILILILILTIPTHLLFCRRVSLPSQSACDHPPTSCEPCLPCIPQWGPPSHRQRQPAYQPQRPANLQRPILQSLWWWPAFRPRLSARLLEGKGDLCHCFLSPYSTWNGLCVGEPTRMKYTQKKMKCTWPTQEICAWGSMQPIFHWLALQIFSRHDVGIFALGDAKVPNANGFASQWNIGFSVCENSFILSRVTHSPPLGPLTGGPDVKCQF